MRLSARKLHSLSSLLSASATLWRGETKTVRAGGIRTIELGIGRKLNYFFPVRGGVHFAARSNHKKKRAEKNFLRAFPCFWGCVYLKVNHAQRRNFLLREGELEQQILRFWHSIARVVAKLNIALERGSVAARRAAVSAPNISASAILCKCLFKNGARDYKMIALRPKPRIPRTPHAISA